MTRWLVLLFATSVFVGCSPPTVMPGYVPEYDLPSQERELHSKREDPTAGGRRPEHKPEQPKATELPPCGGAVESGGAIVFTRRGTPCEGE